MGMVLGIIKDKMDNFSALELGLGFLVVGNIHHIKTLEPGSRKYATRH
jgi:hypothetical protein